MNGLTTLDTNIADNGGMRMAYEALLEHEKTHGAGQRLPGLTDYSSNQLFFLNMAQVKL